MFSQKIQMSVRVMSGNPDTTDSAASVTTYGNSAHKSTAEVDLNIQFGCTGFSSQTTVNHTVWPAKKSVLAAKDVSK